MDAKRRNAIIQSMSLKNYKYGNANDYDDDTTFLNNNETTDDDDDNDNEKTNNGNNKNTSRYKRLKNIKSKKIKLNNNYNDDDDEDDDETDENNDNDNNDNNNNDDDDNANDTSIFGAISKTSKNAKQGKKSKLRNLTNGEHLKLPGGQASALEPYQLKCSGTSIGEAPRKVVQNIRDYMDILLNSAFIEAKLLTALDTQQSNSMLAIPGIVAAILEYNNISFKHIKYCVTTVDLFEPVWYTYSVSKNELLLYLNEAMYEEFCSKNNHDPVIFTSGIIPIELFNPYESDPTIGTDIQAPIIHCAIASDHVAQHIISDLYCKNKVGCLDIHEKFTEVGTTLHSMFYLERTCVRMPKREYANFLTVGNSSTSTPHSTLMPLMRSTQRIIDSILPPSNQTSTLSDTFAI